MLETVVITLFLRKFYARTHAWTDGQTEARKHGRTLHTHTHTHTHVPSKHTYTHTRTHASTNLMLKRVHTVIKVFLFKSLFFAALHLFKELWKSCLVIPLPCALTLKSLSLILGFSLDLSLVTIKFWLLNTLSQLQVWCGIYFKSRSCVKFWEKNCVIQNAIITWNDIFLEHVYFVFSILA
jgi:hypothetical protein